MSVLVGMAMLCGKKISPFYPIGKKEKFQSKQINTGLWAET